MKEKKEHDSLALLESSFWGVREMAHRSAATQSRWIPLNNNNIKDYASVFITTFLCFNIDFIKDDLCPVI